LLDYAGLLHDIGEHVSTENHDQHSAYLVLHGRLRGFTPDEVALLASVCRFHRRGTPKATFDPFGALDPRDQDRATALVGLLRIADGLDRSHGAVVDDVRVRLTDDGIRIGAVTDADIGVELWSMAKKRELMERVCDRPVTVVATRPRARRSTVEKRAL
jgi:exopolyphosphatase/guanosine-5'-triphosphate,3'-diphosphate pyrophosphatase